MATGGKVRLNVLPAIATLIVHINGHYDNNDGLYMPVLKLKYLEKVDDTY